MLSSRGNRRQRHIDVGAHLGRQRLADRGRRAEARRDRAVQRVLLVHAGDQRRRLWIEVRLAERLRRDVGDRRAAAKDQRRAVGERHRRAAAQHARQPPEEPRRAAQRAFDRGEPALDCRLRLEVAARDVGRPSKRCERHSRFAQNG